MLTETWEHLRGYKNWTAAVATIQTSRVEDAGFGDVLSICTIVWQDQDRVVHTGEFEVVEGSTLYQLCEHDTVDIRFNPTKPDEFYLPNLLQSKLARVARLTFFSVLMILLWSALLYLGSVPIFSTRSRIEERTYIVLRLHDRPKENYNTFGVK